MMSICAIWTYLFQAYLHCSFALPTYMAIFFYKGGGVLLTCIYVMWNLLRIKAWTNRKIGYVEDKKFH